MEPPWIPIIKEMFNDNSDEYFVEIKFCRYTTFSTLELFDFILSLFDHGNPEEFILFVRNFNMILSETGMLEMDAKIQYLRTLVCE